MKIHAKVKSFYESNDDSTLWIATSEGLVKLNKKNFKFSMITSKDGLPNDFVYAVLPDEQGNLWLSTNSGICKFNSLEFSFKNFTTRDGLQSNEFNTNGYVLCHDGEMWFSGVNGFNAFYPEKIKDDSITPSVQITAMKVNDEPFNSPNYIGETSALTLPFSERTVSFDFTAINFSEPKNVKLEYRLSGIDASWISTSNPGFARYPNLPSGNYQFQIKAANSDGIWNPQMKSLQLIIQTPFYRTWWFMMLIVLIIAALLYSIYRYRVNQILKLHAVRNRIARDLHDDIGSSLSSIRIMSELVSKQKNLEKSAEMMNKIGNESQQAMDAIRDIVWSVNPDNDSLDNMWLRMQEYAAEILEAKNITYHFEANDHLEQLKLPMNHRRDFYLIFKEAINNLSKYSGAQNVAITLHHESKRLLLKIKDDGRGFDASSSMNGNGIRNMKKRADQLNGKISIASENGIGTSIVLEVPVT